MGRLLDIYIALLGACRRHSRVMIAALVLLWGLPLWLLPDSIAPVLPETDGGWPAEAARLYEDLWMDEQFDHEVKPLLFRALGGVSYLFFEKVHKGELFDQGQNRSLMVTLEMPSNMPVQRIEQVCFGFETALEPYMGRVERITVQYSKKKAIIEVLLAEGAERTPFPNELYAAVQGHAAGVGGVGLTITGLGFKYFQMLLGDWSRFSVKATGNDYLRLREIAEQFADQLSRHERIRNVDIDVTDRFADDKMYEIVGRLDADGISAYRLDKDRVVRAVMDRTSSLLSRHALWVAGDLQDVAVKFRGTDAVSAGDVRGAVLPASGDAARVRVGDLATLQKSRIQTDIVRENQTYVRTINMDYLGSDEHGTKLIDLFIGRSELPYGFSLTQEETRWYMDGENNRQMVTVLCLAVLVVWMIAACLFESWTKPFLVLLAVPLALIGLFAAFYALGASFDTGGYIAVLFLAGIAVNNAFLMLYQMDAEAKGGAGDRTREVFTAAAHRLKPIAVTTLTTLAGLLPILLFEDAESLWYPLAVGVTGGMVVSTVLLPVCLPVFYMELTRATEKPRLFTRKR